MTKKSNRSNDFDDSGDAIEQNLRDELHKLERLEATGKAPPDTAGGIEAIRYLLSLRGSRRLAAPKSYGKARPDLTDFDRAADKWGNA